jgi:hypothetical protein
MDLSKAFDCLPHDILLCKLSPKSVELLRNYLTGRKQQIKLQGDLSSWADIQKGLAGSSFCLKGQFFYVVEQPELLLTWFEKHWF